MQKFKVADDGNPDGSAKDLILGVQSGTKYKSKVWNDNLFNLFKFVESQGYTLIDDDLEQISKATKSMWVNSFTYNTSSLVTQTVNDIVRGSDGKYYEVQNNSITGDDPVGSSSGNWLQVDFDKGLFDKYVALTGNQTIAGIKTFSSFPVTPSTAPSSNYQTANKKYVDDNSLAIGQSWQDLLGSRVSGVTYTNTTGRPIDVSVTGTIGSGTGSTMSFIVDGAQIAFEQGRDQTYNHAHCITLIIPSGSTYEVDIDIYSFNEWWELR